MLVNSTKTTIQPIKIAISYSNEDGFVAINKIIQILKLLKINITIEIINIAGKYYEQGVINGITEEDDVNLKKNHILIHTPFDLSFFTQSFIYPEDYLNFTLQNCFKKSVFITQNSTTQEEYIATSTTNFFQHIEPFIADKNIFFNDNNFKEIKNNELHNTEINSNFDVFYGKKHCVFALNKLDETSLLRLLKELLSFLKIETMFEKIQSCLSTQEAINYLKENQNTTLCEIKNPTFATDFELKQSFLDLQLPTSLSSATTQLTGCFLVEELVRKIKNEEIQIPENMEIYKVFSNNIEVFPNISFWNEKVVNPKIVLHKKEF